MSSERISHLVDKHTSSIASYTSDTSSSSSLSNSCSFDFCNAPKGSARNEASNRSSIQARAARTINRIGLASLSPGKFWESTTNKSTLSSASLGGVTSLQSLRTSTATTVTLTVTTTPFKRCNQTANVSPASAAGERIRTPADRLNKSKITGGPHRGRSASHSIFGGLIENYLLDATNSSTDKKSTPIEKSSTRLVPQFCSGSRFEAPKRSKGTHHENNSNFSRLLRFKQQQPRRAARSISIRIGKQELASKQGSERREALGAAGSRQRGLAGLGKTKSYTRFVSIAEGAGLTGLLRKVTAAQPGSSSSSSSSPTPPASSSRSSPSSASSRLFDTSVVSLLKRELAKLIRNI
jgi:hypothetical protein